MNTLTVLPPGVWLKSWRGVFALALFTTMLPHLAAQSANGRLQGIVTDARSHSPLNGAVVHLDGTELETTTDRTGAYNFPAVPAGSYKLSASYLGLDPAGTQVTIVAGQVATRDFGLTGETVTLAAFTVESIREGQSRAINEQRAASSLRNVISGDAIGNLPDNTVAEALSRVPGVNIVQSDSQDSYVTVRGAISQLNAVHVDGQGLPAITDPLAQSASSETRAIDLSLIPSEIVSSVEVIKSLTPDSDADSIGGKINLKTKSGFDVGAPVTSGSFDFYYNDFKQKHGAGGSLSFLGALNPARTIGLGVDVNYRDIRSDEEQSDIIYQTVTGIPGITKPDAFAEFDGRLRERRKVTRGASVNLDLKLGSRTVLKFRTFYNSSSNYETQWRTRWAGLAAFNATSTDTLQSGTNARMRKLYYEQLSAPKIYQLGFSGTTTLESGRLDYNASYNYSPTRAWLKRVDSDTPSATRRLYSFTVDRTNPVEPKVSIFNTASKADGAFTGDDAILMIWRMTDGDSERNHAEHADYTLHKNFGAIPVDFKFGVKDTGKVRRARPVLSLMTPVVAPLMKTFPQAEHQPPGNLLFSSVPTLGSYQSLPAVFAYQDANPNNFVPQGTSQAVVTTLLARMYDVSEDVDAGYGMATARFGKLEAIAGVRYENTRNTHTLRSANPHVHGSRTYGNALPDLLANYRFTPNLILRAAWTHTIARPDYNELLPYTLSSDPAPSPDTTDVGTLISIYKGNPNLSAQRSSNLDVALEWYYQPAGLVSVGAFRKDLTGFIYRSTSLQTIGGQPFVIHQFQNGATATENGIELAWEQTFPRLPGPLSGLGFNANTSIIEGKSTIWLLNVTNNTQYALNQNFIPQQPRAIRNIQLFWEKYGITARVAFNYVAANINAVDGKAPNAVIAPIHRLDASLNYRVTKNFILYVQGKNLRRQTEQWYDTTPQFPERFHYAGRTFIGGVKYHF